ncbi:hypothetical protein [Paractinoplanes atraurantiacus]|uniref:Uncharacterized protein n=1 Tax=Paractinoplanes atraurantiacus TaxID=1036182 RepID=A0A285GZK1_9ACTN|nr:hypothetical protein [Actinoplanes atraurantiacus]SNY28927.1 hypothetical protein SAMN05421748_103159 [Actinoplanes atraurantiacus]
MASIELTPGAAAVLQAVAAGKVRRHRLRAHESPALGTDFEDVPGHGPGGKRKATGRLKPLIAKNLVVLPPGPPDAEAWPWATTELGDTVLEILNRAEQESDQ